MTYGLENNWVQKLVAITSPVRVTPTDEYYNSYYYLIDSISQNSNYSLKSIGEKLESLDSDPYDLDFDEEIPAHLATADIDQNGQVKDLVKLANKAIIASGGAPTDYEMTISNLKITLKRGLKDGH